MKVWLLGLNLNYSLKVVGERYGAHEYYDLDDTTLVGESATWKVWAIAPTAPGVHQQRWQMFGPSGPVGPEVIVYVIVVPEEARELKRSIENKLAELRRQSEKKSTKYFVRLRRKLLIGSFEKLDAKLEDVLLEPLPWQQLLL